MHFLSDGEPKARAASVSDEVLDGDEDVEDEEDRPDDALTCPLLDTPIHFDDCKLCHGRGWVVPGAVSAYLGPYRVPCMSCGGEGDEESGGPITWTCFSCLGTGVMPVASLAEERYRRRPIAHLHLRGFDLRGLRLDRLVFRACDFSLVNFDGADLTRTKFERCQFAGANPEAAASLAGTRLRVAGLTEAQRAACVARGAVVLALPA